MYTAAESSISSLNWLNPVGGFFFLNQKNYFLIIYLLKFSMNVTEKEVTEKI